MVNIGTCNAGRPLDAFLVVVAALAYSRWQC